MAATRVQVSAGASIASGLTLADSWLFATTPGNLLLAVVPYNNWPSQPTFGAHADWGDPIINVMIGAGGGVRPGIAVYAITDAASRSGSESFDPSVDSDCTLHLIEIETDHASLPLILVSDDWDENAAGSSTASSGTSSPSTLVEYALAVINSRPTNADQSSPTNSFTAVAELESRDSSEGVHTGIYELFPDAVGGYETSVTLAGTTYWLGVILGFAATEPPAPPPIEHIAGVSSVEAAPTTSFTITIPANVEEGDLLDLTFVHRGTGDGSVSDNDSGSWTRKGEALFASSAFTIQHYFRFATAASAGKTITVTGLTNSCAPALVVYRANGVVFAADPYEAWSAEANASGNETHAELTTLTPDAMVCLVVGNSPDLGVSAQACTTPGALTERVEKLSTGGTDSSIAHASARRETAGATGSLTWSQTNAASGSIAYAIGVEAGGHSVAAGTAAETDSALAVGRAKTRSAGVVSGAELALALARVKRLAVQTAAGGEVALPITARKTRLVVAALETEAARAVTTAGQLVAIEPALESEAAQPLPAAKSRLVGVVVAVGAAQLLGRAKRRLAAAAAESDVAGVLGKTRALAAALEAELAAPAGRVKRRAVDVAGEASSALAAGKAKRQPLTTAGESGSAIEVGRRKALLVLVAAGTEAALPVEQLASRVAATAEESQGAQLLGRAKQRLAVVVVESDAAGILGKSRAVQTSLEVELAPPAGRAKLQPLTAAGESDAASVLGKTRAVQAALESDLAPPTGRAKRRQLDVAGEASSALAAGKVKLQPLTAAGESDAAGVLGRARSILPAAETEEALGMGRSGSRDVVAAIEANSAPAAGRAKRLAAAAALEGDAAQTLGTSKRRAAVSAEEADAAAALGRAKRRNVVVAAESDSGFALDAAKSRLVLVAAETGTARSLGRVVVAAAASETTVASALVRHKSRPVATVQENNAAVTVSWHRTRAAATAPEASLALPILRIVGPPPGTPAALTLAGHAGQTLALDRGGVSSIELAAAPGKVTTELAAAGVTVELEDARQATLTLEAQAP